MKTLLQNLRNTLDKIEVRGQENLNMLLGCIFTLDKVISDMKHQEAQGSIETEGGADDDNNERGIDA